MIQLDHKESQFIEERFPVILVLDSVTGPANVGSLFRLADAFNVERILLCGASFNELSSSRVRRTARSTTKTVAYASKEDALRTCTQLKEDGYTLIALEITRDSQALESLQYKKFQKIALVIGNERSGIGEEILSIAENKIHIRMFGKNSSMNVSHATGIALFEITKSL